MSRKLWLNKTKFALVDDEAYDWLNSCHWVYQKIGKREYAFFNKYIPKYKRKRFWLHRVIMDAQPGEDVDHINQNGLDCRIENMRVCSRSQNQMNTRRQSNNKSGYKNVTWNRHYRRWQVTVRREGKYYHGGNHVSLASAAIAAKKLRDRIHGEFSCE